MSVNDIHHNTLQVTMAGSTIWTNYCLVNYQQMTSLPILYKL